MSAVGLDENVYNRGLRADEAKFKVWSSAGLMLTYWCPSRCACCYVYSGPEAGSVATEMSVSRALECWRGVRRLAGARGKIHISGGEPFGDYERLKNILQAGREEKLEGLEKIETNAYWCTEEALVRSRLGELRELGLQKLQISTDVYHQEWVGIENVKLAERVGKEVLGEEGVQVRWRDFLAEPVPVGSMSEPERAAAFGRALQKRGERMLGRAAEKLVSLLPLRDYEVFGADRCGGSLLGARHVHIDGAGNVFMGTCVGIIAGGVSEGADMGLEELWRKFDYRAQPILSILVEKGPTGLMALAEPLGYIRRKQYVSKCHLCYEVRRFLYQSGEYRGCLGPNVCYGLPAENCKMRQS